MNRKRRKAIKMLKRRYGRATNPFWVARDAPLPEKLIALTALKGAIEALRALPLTARPIPPDSEPDES